MYLNNNDYIVDGQYGRTPSYFACTFGQYDNVKFLFEENVFSDQNCSIVISNLAALCKE